jgi:hypothetical protein
VDRGGPIRDRRFDHLVAHPVVERRVGAGVTFLPRAESPGSVALRRDVPAARRIARICCAQARRSCRAPNRPDLLRSGETFLRFQHRPLGSARPCLVHRAGRRHRRELPEPNGFDVRWRAARREVPERNGLGGAVSSPGESFLSATEPASIAGCHAGRAKRRTKPESGRRSRPRSLVVTLVEPSGERRPGGVPSNVLRFAGCHACDIDGSRTASPPEVPFRAVPVRSFQRKVPAL